MWFWFSLIALLCWSGSDLFSKIGCQDADDKYSQFKMVIAVGVVMGLHAAYEIFIGGTEISWDVIVTYLPVSLLYIVSMTLGYVGLRYIELSISSPICNSSGALVAVLTLITSGIGGLAVGPTGVNGQHPALVAEVIEGRPLRQSLCGEAQRHRVCLVLRGGGEGIEPGQGHPEQAEGDGKGAQGVKQAENYFPHGENHSFPAGLSSGSMRKNAAPETEVHNFHTGMLYFTGGSVLY